MITTSGRGMLVFDDERLLAHARKVATQAREPVLYYEPTAIGYNCRMSNLLAGIGRARLSVADHLDHRSEEVWCYAGRCAVSSRGC